MNRKLLVLISIFVIVFSLNFIFAGTLSVDKNETYINDTVVISGTGFTPDSNVFIQNNLEPNSAWWDGYNEQWGFPIKVLTNSSGDFNYSWTIPYDFRLSPGKQQFSVGDKIHSAIEWNGGGEYPTSKNGIVCVDSFCYTTSTFPNGGIEKFNMNTGERDCNLTFGSIGKGIATDGTYIYSVNNTTTGNIIRASISDCSVTYVSWDISAAAVIRTLSVSAKDTVPTGVTFNDTGTEMYVVGSTNDSVYQYTLSGAWDISTATWTRTLSVSAKDTAPSDVTFKPDGTAMYIIGDSSDAVHQYTLSGAWNISTASFTRTLSVSAKDTAPSDVTFNDTGTEMYVVGSNSDSVHQYTLSSAWNISTASFTRTLSVSAKETVSTGVTFNDTGTEMYVVGSNSDSVHQYTLSSAWDISTATWTRTVSVAAKDTVPNDVIFKPDGTSMYIVGDSSDSVHQYDLIGFSVDATNTTRIKISNDNFAFITYEANRAPAKYENLTTIPTKVVAFAPAARNSIANDICISPDNTKVIVGYADGNILAYDYTTGATLWNSDPDDDVTQSVSGLHCDNDKIYVAKAYNSTSNGPLFGGFAYALSATDGSLVWRSERIDSHYVYSSYNHIACDSVNCYAAVLSPPIGGGGINGGSIIQIKKSDGTIGWVNWRSWLPASTEDYGAGNIQASPMDLWVDSDENGFIYSVYSTGRIQKLYKNDVDVESFPDTNLWIRSNTNLYNFVMNPTKNVFYSNERPSFNFKAVDSNGQYLDTDDNRFYTSHLKFSVINAFNEFTATETGSASVASQFMDPRIMTAYSTSTSSQPNPTPYNYLRFMYNDTDRADGSLAPGHCPTTTYTDTLYGWHIFNRFCLYENMELSHPTLLHTQNGVQLTATQYALVLPDKWSDYPITKTYGTDNWAWLSNHNPDYNQMLGFATRFGANQDEVWSDQLGRSTLFMNTATATSYIYDYVNGTNDFWHEAYFFFKPLGPGTDGNRHWKYVDNDTQMIANPISVIQGDNQSGSFVIGADTFSNRIDFNATEPGLMARINEPFWFDVNFIDGIKSDCSDLVVTDNTDTPIGLFQLDSESCTADNNYTLFVQDDFTVSETKEYRLYYNSSTAAITAAGPTDLVTTLISGTCAAGSDLIDVNSTNWFRWVRPGTLTSETVQFNFGGDSTNWFNSAATHFQLRVGYKNSQSANTGAGLTTDTLATVQATFASRCYQRSYNGDKIFTRIDMNSNNFTVTPHLGTAQVRKLMTRWYFFNNTGRVRVMSKLDSPLPVMETGISQNYNPYYYWGTYSLVPQGTVNDDFFNWSGRTEVMDEYNPVVYSADKKSAVLTPSPLPLKFTIDYNQEHFANVYSASSQAGKGCTVHKVWPYFSWRPIDPLTTTNATTFPSAYTTDFISCDEDLNGTIPDVGNDGYVNVFPKESIYGTGLNKFVDPNLIAKFYLKPNLYIPDNRENRWLPPLALNAQYGTSAKVSTLILDVCPTEEYGYKGYDDFLADLDNLISANSSHKVETNTNNIPCATSVVIFSTNTGSIGKYFLFQRDVNVVVGDVAPPSSPYPSNLYIPGTATLNVNGTLDYTFAQKAVQYYGKWFFTSSSDPYVISGYATTGAEQLSGAVRYAWAPSFTYNKKAYSESAFWVKEDSNLTYQQSPCAWNFGINYWGDMDFGPGWKKTFSSAQQGTICPRNNNNIEQYSSFRPAVASLYPTSALVNTAIDNVIDGRPNKPTASGDLGIDAALFSRHNSLWDYKHFSDYTQVVDEFSQLNEGPKHSNVEPWQCDFSRYDSKNFCLVPATTTSLIYTATPGTLTATTASGMWSPYYQSDREYTVLRNYLNNVWFNTAAMFPTYDFLTEKAIFPMLGETEFTFDTLYTSNNPDDYNDLMDKLFPRLYPAFYQNQFLLRDWKNTAFMVLSGGDTREYLRGTTIDLNGFFMKDSESLSNAPIIIQVFKNSVPTTPLATYQTVTDENGDFNYSYTISTIAEPGLYFFKAIYNNGEITGTTSYRVSALNISTVLDKSVYVAGDGVYVTTTITDATIGSLITDANVNMIITGPAGNTLLSTTLTNEGLGVYTYFFQLSPETVNGTYLVTITATTAENTGSATVAFSVGVQVSSINVINNFQLADANKEYITQVTIMQNVVATPQLEFTINYQLSDGLDLENIVLFTKDDIVLTRVHNFSDLNRTTYYLSLDSSNNPIVYIMANFEPSQIRTMTFIAENKYYDEIEEDYNSASNYEAELDSYCAVLLTPAAQADCALANTLLTDINGYYTEAQTANTVDQFYIIKEQTNEEYNSFMTILTSLRAIATNQANCQIFVPSTWALDSNVSLAILMTGPSLTPLTGLSFDVNLYDSDFDFVQTYTPAEFGGGWYYKSFLAPSTGGGYTLKIDQNIGTNRFLCSAAFDVNQANSSASGEVIGGGLTTDQNQTLYMIYFLALDINSMVNSISGTVNTISDTVNTINGTVNTINDTVNTINGTVNNIDSNVNYVKTNMVTIGDISSLESYIQSILDYSIDINTQVYGSASTIDQLQSSLTDINATVNSIKSTTTDINHIINTCEDSPQASICGQLSILTSNLSDMNGVLNNVNSTVLDINTTNTEINQTILDLNSTTNNIYSTVTDINNTSYLINSQLSLIDSNIQSVIASLSTLEDLLDCSTTPQDSVCERLINLELVVSNINQAVIDQNALLQQILAINQDINNNVNTINNSLVDMNTTINNINSTVNEINITVTNIDSNVIYIKSNMATTGDITSLDASLQSILAYSEDINNTVTSSSSQLDLMSFTLDDIDSNVNYIQSTVTDIQDMIETCSSAPAGGVCDQLASLYNDLQDMNNTLVGMNSTVENIDSTTSTINQNIIDINTTATNIYSTVTDINTTSGFILTKVTSIEADTQDIQLEIQDTQSLLDCSGTPPQYSVCDNLLTISSLVADVNLSTQTSLLGIIDTLSTMENNQDDIAQSISAIMSDLNCADENSVVCDNMQIIISGINSLDSGIVDLNTTVNSISNTVLDINGTTTTSLSVLNNLTNTLDTISGDIQDINSGIQDTQSMIIDTNSNLTGLLEYLSQNITDLNLSNNLSLLDIISSLGTIENNQATIDGNLSLIYNELNCVANPTSPICSNLQTIINNTDSLETSITDLNSTMQTIGTTVFDINSSSLEILNGIQDLNNNSSEDLLAAIIDVNSNINNTTNLIINIDNILQDVNDTITDVNDIVGDINGTVDDIGGTTGGTSDKVDEIKNIVLNIDNNVSEINNTLTDINAQQAAIQATLASMQLTLSDINDTTTNIYTDQQSRFTVAISDFSEIGSGDIYRAKLWVFDYDGSPKDADSNNAKITLYDPERNIITENITMTRLSEGVYTYDYNVGTGQIAGIWEAVATVLVNGENVSPSDFWELVGNPPEVRINSIVDTSIPTITADVIITNEGSASQEYQYEYCIVSNQSNMCGGGDDVDYSSGAKLILPGQTWNTELTLNVPTVGTYWFKIKVYYGVEMSAASKQFVATTGGTNTGGTGGGSSDISDVTGLVSLPVAVGEIAIIEYPTDMTIIQGDYGFYTLRIKNIGSIDLSDIKLTIEDLPESWWEIQQEKTILSPNEEGSFVIKLKAPMDAEVKDTLVKFKISSKEDTRLRESILRVLEKSLAEIRFVDVKVSPIKVNGYGEIEFIIQNMSLYDQNITATLLVPRDWQIEDSDQAIILKGGETKRIIFVVNASYISGVRDLVFVIKNNTGQRFKTGEDKLFKQLMVIVINDEKVKSELNFFNQFNGIGIGILIIILLLVILIIIFLFGIKNNNKQRPSLGYNRNILDKLMGLRRK